MTTKLEDTRAEWLRSIRHCHYCNSPTIIYRKFIKDRINETWVRLDPVFNSCQRLHCPYHFDIKANVEYELYQEYCRFEVSPFNSLLLQGELPQ